MKRLSLRLRRLEAQRQPAERVTRVVVYDDYERREYPSRAAALAAHPWLRDPARCITITARDED